MRTLSIFLILLFVFTACEKKKTVNTPSGKVVTIGVLVSVDAKGTHKQIEGLQSLIRVSGYLKNGDKLQLKIAPVEKTPEESFDRLVKNSDLVAVISLLGSTDTLKLTKRIERAKIPFIATVASHTEISKITYVSQICLNNRTEAHVAASYLRDELFVSKVSIFSDHDDAFSMELSEFFQERFERLEGVVQYDFDISELDQDPQGLIKKLKNNKIDTLYITIAAEKTKLLLEALANENLKMDILGHDSLLNPFKIKFPDDLDILEGVFVVDNYADELVITPHAKKIRDRIRSEDLQIASYDALVYDALSLLRQGLDACGSSDAECVNTLIRNTASFEGVADELSMSEGKVYRQVYVNEIKEGKMLMKVKVY